GKADLSAGSQRSLLVRPPPISVAGSVVVTSRLTPKPIGATASRKRCRGPAELDPVVSRRDVVQCLSCMRRNGARAVLRGGGAGDSTSLPDRGVEPPRQDHPPRKRADFPRVSRHETVRTTGSGGRADDGSLAAGAASGGFRSSAPDQYRAGGAPALHRVPRGALGEA